MFCIRWERYKQEYDELADRYDAAKEKVDAVEAQIVERTAARETVEMFLKELGDRNGLLTEFSEDA